MTDAADSGTAADGKPVRGRTGRRRRPKPGQQESSWDTANSGSGAADGAVGVDVQLEEEADENEGQARRTHYAQQLMQPEWMTDVPPDLSTSWYVMPRPQGVRCLLIASRGSTVSRLRNGAVLHRFLSSLPDGGCRGGGGAACSYDSCVLDCIFHEPDATYYVQDLLSWRGHSLLDCTTEFRMYWLAAKQLEEPEALLHASSGTAGPSGAATGDGSYSVRLLPSSLCGLEGLQAAYQGAVPFVRDGLYLLHKDGVYQAGGSSPLAVLWKDAVCSTYLLDTDAAGTALEHQVVTLEYAADQTVTTGDAPPIVLGRMPDVFVKQMGDKLRPGRLLRFTVQEGGLQFQHGRPVGGDLRYVGPANQRRGRSDLFSKVMFQYCARRQPITLLHLAAAITAQPAPAPVAAVTGVALTGEAQVDMDMQVA